MQSVQRQFGKLNLTRKGPGDNAKVSMILSDYDDADKVFAQVRFPRRFVSSCHLRWLPADFPISR